MSTTKILAIKKADMLADIGVQFSKSIHDTVTCYDDSITYTLENVNHKNIGNKKSRYARRHRKPIFQVHTRYSGLL